MILSSERRPARRLGVLLSAVLAVVLGAVAAGAQTPAAEQVGAQAPRTYATNSYAAVVSRAAPAVVTVRSQRRVTASEQRIPFLDDPTLREFFGDRLPQGRQVPRPERQRGLGSGVIVSPDGYILTNHHVVEGAEQITIELTDRRTLSAKLVGSDPPSDLAVLKVDVAGLPSLPLGDSDRVQVGDVVLAIGNPLGIGQTVTSGIISAKGRQTGLGDGSFEDFLQTDAAINRGNSGGALISADGELIGINSQILSPSGGSIGIGFAIPSNMARDVMSQLVKSGRVRRGMVGVTIQPVTADIAASLDIGQPRGALVSSVMPGGPAERAGLRRGDIIVAVNNAPVADSNTFRNTVARMQPGTPASVTVLRDGREQQFRLTLGELPAETSRGGREGEGDDPGEAEGGRLGVTVEPLTPEAAARLELPRDTRGLAITGVNSDGPAAEAGLRRGDVIQEVNRQPVRTAEELRAALDRAGTRPALLLVTNERGTGYVTVRPRR
ncbi:MAG TPA: Do family serine endopeptidase [Pyrinomonadaceae bacterium]|nr:Do family serine endopeptidase [Pyrinomonadaceae bacterium]